MRVEARLLSKTFESRYRHASVAQDLQPGLQCLEVDREKFLIAPKKIENGAVFVDVIKQEGALLISQRAAAEGTIGEIPDAEIIAGDFEQKTVALPINQPWYLVYPGKVYRITYLGNSAAAPNASGLEKRVRLRIDSSPDAIETRILQPQINLMQIMQANFANFKARRGIV